MNSSRNLAIKICKLPNVYFYSNANHRLFILKDRLMKKGARILLLKYTNKSKGMKQEQQIDTSQEGHPRVPHCACVWCKMRNTSTDFLTGSNLCHLTCQHLQASDSGFLVKIKPFSILQSLCLHPPPSVGSTLIFIYYKQMQIISPKFRLKKCH